jgi:hypothetical protein
MHKVILAIIVASLMFASPVAAKSVSHKAGSHKAVSHHRRARQVHSRKHRHHRRKHRHHRRKHHASAAVVAKPAAPVAAPSPPAQMIGVGNPPGCLTGANPTPYLRLYRATVLRIVLSPYVGGPGIGGQAIPCLKAAIAAGARVEIAIQWRSVWSPAQAASFVREELALYAPYVWAVGLGNEQELWWGLPGQPADVPQTAAEYVSDWNAAEPILANMAPQAIRVAVESGPWGFPFTQQVLADGLPGAQVLAMHPYTVPASYPQVGDFYNLATSHGMPLWCTEGLAGPDAYVNFRFPPQTLAQLAVCKVAVAWWN